MELTYKQLLDAQQLTPVLLQLKPAPSARMAAQIARNLRMVEQALRDFDTARDVLVTPYKVDGVFDDAVEEALDPDTKQALQREYDDLLETSVTIDIHPLKLAALEALEEAKPGFEIPAAIFFFMPWMIDENAG